MNALTPFQESVFSKNICYTKSPLRKKYGGGCNVGTIAQAVVTVGKSPSAKDNAASLRSPPGSYIRIDC